MSDKPPRLTPFGVIDKYLSGSVDQPRYTKDAGGGPLLGWSSFHAQEIVDRLTAEGYEISNKVNRERLIRARIAAAAAADDGGDVWKVVAAMRTLMSVLDELFTNDGPWAAEYERLAAES